MSDLIRLHGPTGITAELDPYGARLISLSLTVEGKRRDVVLGFDDRAGYEANPNLFFGATIGRVANRIGGAAFTMNGVEYRLTSNEGRNHLHGGGDRRFDQVTWSAGSPDDATVEFRHHSPHLEEGYPGELDVTVIYTVTADSLEITFEAVTDRPTPVNMTHHTYWNLNGVETASTVLEHTLQMPADHYTPVGADLIPIGTIEPVAGTPLDFTSPSLLGPRVDALCSGPGDGLDHNFAVTGWDGTLRPVARVSDAGGTLTMEVRSTQPGIQVYSGNHLPPTVGKNGVIYPTHGGICLEPQHFPDSVHNEGFPTILIGPDHPYQQAIDYRFETG